MNCHAGVILACLLAPHMLVQPDHVAAGEGEVLHLSPSRSNQESSRSPRRPSWGKTASALVAVTAGLLGLFAVCRRYIPGAGFSRSRAVQVLARAPLDAQCAIHLVRCGPRILILGRSGGTLTTLAEIADPAEIDQFIDLCRPDPPG